MNIPDKLFSLKPQYVVLAVAAFVIVVALVSYVIAFNLPNGDAIREWSISEAIFYGCLAISVAIFLRGR